MLVVLYVCVLTYNSLRHEGRFSPDSVVYVDAARSLAAGRGLATSMVPLSMAVDGSATVPLPMTAWGPLYPILIASVTQIGVPATAAALLIPPAFLALTLLGAYLLASRLFDLPAALLGVACLLHFGPLRVAATHAWSETVGVAFLVLSLCLTLSSNGTRARRVVMPFLAGLTAALAFASRYALVPVFLVGFVLLIERRRSFRNFGIYVVGFCVITAPIMIRNVLLTGYLRGAPGYSSWDPTGPIPSDLVRRVCHAALPASWIACGLYSVLGVALILACALRICRHTFLTSAAEALWAKKRYLLILWPAVYFAFLLYSKMRFPIDTIDARLALPATAMLVLLCAGLFTRVVSGRTWLYAVLSIILATFAIMGEFSSTRAFSNTRLPPVYDMERYVARSESLTWLAARATEHDLIVAEDGMDVPFFLGPIDTLYSVDFWPWSGQVSLEDFARYLKTHRAKYEHVYVLLRRGPLYEAQAHGQRPEFFRSVAETMSNPVPGITVEAQFDDGDIFSIALPASG